MASFSKISFSPVSFDVGQENDPNSSSKTRNRFRSWIAGWARDIKRFFHIKPVPPPVPPVEIPPAQSPAGKTVIIYPEPPNENTKLETLNDKWSVVASIPSPIAAESAAKPEPIYPLILNPLTAPLIQTKVTLPRATRTPKIPPYRVGEGSHIESQLIGFKKPRNRSKTASTINTLMILLEIESKL
jgi:hypothetical protein